MFYSIVDVLLLNVLNVLCLNVLCKRRARRQISLHRDVLRCFFVSVCVLIRIRIMPQSIVLSCKKSNVNTKVLSIDRVGLHVIAYD